LTTEAFFDTMGAMQEKNERNENMGKLSKAQEAEQRRQYQEARRREEAEKQRKQNKLMWQIILCIVAAVVVIAAVPLVMMLVDKNEEPPLTGSTVTMAELDLSAVKPDNCTVTDEITDHVRLNVSYTDANGIPRTGDIVIRLFQEIAPQTVKNFQELVAADFYDGLTFHRVSPGFMIQGGDPKGNGSGDSGKNLHGEFRKNGFQNNLEHVRGAVSMARGNGYNSASCQFFIVHEDSRADLDGLYASFGYVVYGMETVDAITEIDLDYKAGSIDTVPTSPRYPVTINDASFVKITE